MLTRISFVLLVAAVLTGCATIIQGKSQQVSISSNPSNARVLVDSKDMGQTPLVTRLSRKQKHNIKIELAGYQPYEVATARKVNGWIAGNIVFGGIIGLGVDAATGAMYKISPAQVTAGLQSGSMSAVQQNNQLFITVVMQPDPSWELIDQLQPISR